MENIEDTKIITTLPYEALRNYSIEWSAAGLFEKGNILISLNNVITKDFEQPRPITGIYGCPNFIWNWEQEGMDVGKDAIDNEFKALNTEGFECYLTLTNPNLTEKDLRDVSSNYLLEKCAEYRKNAVIVTSDLLSDYIHKKCPNMRQFSSLSKTLETPKRDKAFYESLASRFDRVIIHPDDNFDLELLASLDNKTKFEIIVNMNCLIGCPHMKKCLSISKDFLEQDELAEFKEKNCIMYEKQMDIQKGGANEQKLRNLNLMPEEVDEIAALGFRHFNIMGRGEPSIPFIYDLTRYTLEKDFIAPLVCKLLMN